MNALCAARCMSMDILRQKSVATSVSGVSVLSATALFEHLMTLSASAETPPRLSKIIGWVEQLDEVDTDGIAPMASVADMKLRWRADEVTDGGIPDKVTANAPDPQKGMFSVPKVVE